MNNANTDITIDNITFSYDNKKIFDGYSATFKAGEFSVIMSPSGSGKTTLLYLIAGLLTPDAGTITYPIPKPRYSMVFQDSRLIETSSVSSNIKLVNSTVTNTAISDCLCCLGLSGYESKKVQHLSGGEKQRVAIARALMADYDILLMDEPFTGLDDGTKLTVINYIKKRTAGKTVLLVTHNQNEADMLSQSIISI